MSKTFPHVWHPESRTNENGIYCVTDKCARCNMKRTRTRTDDYWSVKYHTELGLITKAPICTGTSSYTVPLRKELFELSKSN